MYPHILKGIYKITNQHIIIAFMSLFLKQQGSILTFQILLQTSQVQRGRDKPAKTRFWVQIELRFSFSESLIFSTRDSDKASQAKQTNRSGFFTGKEQKKEIETTHEKMKKKKSCKEKEKHISEKRPDPSFTNLDILITLTRKL